MTNNKEILSLIMNATKLHGHLGPFLVKRVRLGDSAKERLRLDGESTRRVQVTVNIPSFHGLYLRY